MIHSLISWINTTLLEDNPGESLEQLYSSMRPNSGVRELCVSGLMAEGSVKGGETHYRTAAFDEVDAANHPTVVLDSPGSSHVFGYI